MEQKCAIWRIGKCNIVNLIVGGQVGNVCGQRKLATFDGWATRHLEVAFLSSKPGSYIVAVPAPYPLPSLVLFVFFTCKQGWVGGRTHTGFVSGGALPPSCSKKPGGTRVAGRWFAGTSYCPSPKIQKLILHRCRMLHRAPQVRSMRIWSSTIFFSNILCSTSVMKKPDDAPQL